MRRLKKFYIEHSIHIKVGIFILVGLWFIYIMISKIRDDYLMNRIMIKTNERYGDDCYNDRSSTILNKYMINFANDIKDLENSETDLIEFKKTKRIMIDKFDADMKEFCK